MHNKPDPKDMIKKGRGFFAEFREFITKGNVMDMAVGVIIGAAFQNIINSLVNDILMPVISKVTGGVDFTNWFISLDGSHYKTLAQAKKAGAATVNYGTFLTYVINFILMALVIFVMVKIVNRIRTTVEREKEASAPDTKECPYCRSRIPIAAVRCPYCTSELE